MELQQLTREVAEGRHLNPQQARTAADLMVSSKVEAGAKADFLTALSQKGEVAEEISGLALRFRELARDPQLSDWQAQAIDVCGTGGDKVGSFNISTVVVFGLAAAGVPVFKHGNRSITSKCGSANLLEALGVDLMADDAALRRCMEALGFCFMFAPAFHPAFKEIMPVRQQLAAKGQRSVFNLLGPLINPARPAHQLLGVFSAAMAPLLADALAQLGLKSGMVVHCTLPDGRVLDELSVAGRNRVIGFGALGGMDEEWAAADLGLAASPVDDILGGDVEENIALLRRLLDGRAPRGLEDTVVLNIAAGLQVVGRCSELKEGVEAARELLLGGPVKERLQRAEEFFARV